MDHRERVESIIVDACALCEAADGGSASMVALAAARAELLEVAADCDDPELVDDCCGIAAQLERRLVALELEPEPLAAPA